MKLKKVEIFGFKSFADKVVLEFHNGITCIVGPNGCGKSNVSDAMRWVFGEQSAKSMRGSKMPDVIFAGTALRKGLNLAEVTITFSDASSALPIAYDEVAVTRRLHRSGESEYFINRQPVRLKDVQSLFLDSGIGKSAFSIFEQGKIDQIIQASPDQRRDPFEEAAGIGRYLLRKREAFRKFESVDQNLARVKDIHAEVEKQILILEQQAEKAKIFQDEKRILEELERNSVCFRFNQCIKKEREALSKKEAVLKELDLFKEREKELHNELEKCRQHLEGEESRYQKGNEELHAVKSERRSKWEKELASLERRKELDARIIHCQKELEEIRLKRERWAQEIAACKEEQKILEAKLSESRELFSLKENQLQSLDKELSQLRDQQFKSHQEKLKILQQENQIDNELKTHRIRAENHQEKKTHLEEREQKLSLIIEELSLNERKKEEELKAVLTSVDSLKQSLAELELSIKDKAEEIQQTSNEIEKFKKELQECLARKSVLVRLKQDNEGFSAGSKTILAEASRPGCPFYNSVKRLYEFFAAGQGFEVPLALALKPYAETLVVESVEDLKAILAFAKQKELKDFSLICMAHVHDVALEMDERRLDSKISKNPLSTHFLKNIYLVEDLQDALSRSEELTNAQSLTQDLLLLDAQKVIHHGGLKENSVFLREGEIKELAEKSESLEANIGKQKKIYESQISVKRKLEEDRLDLDKSIRSLEMKLVETNFAFQRVQADLEKAKKECGQVAMEVEMIAQTIDHLIKLQKGLQGKMSEIKQKTAGSDASNEALDALLKDKAKERAALVQDVQKAQERLSHALEEARRSSHALNLLEVKNEESENSSERLSAELIKNQELIERLSGEEEKNKKERLELDKLQEEGERRSIGLNEELKKSKTALQDLDSKRNTFLVERKQQEEKLHHFDIQLAQLLTTKEALSKDLKERFEIASSESELEIKPLNEPIEKVERDIKRLRQKLEAAQDINLAAIEDFDKHKVRYQFLNEQVADLESSKSELLQIITALDKESRELFSSTFKTIRDNFKKNFEILFNGGEADLELIESEDVLKAGIEIIAKPPGKKMRSLNLLSGGEKCLTAMALLFSIFEVKSAPFCILDEIDAPLDDTNIERFVKVVKQFIDRCQFIIITHNKRTMAIADKLFGISMQEKGVSKLLSIDFSKQKQTPELVEVSK